MINYSYTNEGKSINERNDCVVRALSIFLDRPYYEIHAELKRFGRRNRCGTNPKTLNKAFEKYGLIKTFVSPKPTLKQFIKEHPKGKFLVHKSKHVFTIKNGTVYDSWKPGSRCRIDYYVKENKNGK